MDLTRRQILKAGLIGAGATLFWHGDTLFGLIGGKRVALAAPIPGGTLNPKNVPKFVTPLLNPPAMPNNGTANNYTIEVQTDSSADTPCGPACHHGVGLRTGRRPASTRRR